MSSRLLTAAVTCTALALVGGGLYLGLSDGDGTASPDGSLPPATRPPVTAPPPATAVVDTLPVELTTTLPVSDDEDGLFPVPNVLGVSQAVAESRLSMFTVSIEVVTATNANDFDEISAQTPGGGERLAAGGNVELVFSERPRPETIEADPFPADQVVSVEVNTISAGECAVYRLDDGVLSFDPVDCDVAHDAQLIAAIQLEDAPDEYDESTIDALLRNQCGALFTEFVGVSDSDSEAFRLFTVRPNAERYVSEGERDSFCVLFPQNGVRTFGSAEGTLW